MKIVCVGFNKTGTTTLQRCLEIVGFGPVASPERFMRAYQYFLAQKHPHFHWQAGGLTPLLRYVVERVLSDEDHNAALTIAEHFTAFKDRPWNVGELYQGLDRKYPGSKFILTVRDTDKWWMSASRWLQLHKENTGKREMYCLHLGVEDWSEMPCKRAYEARNEAIRRYFSGREQDFLEVNFEQGDDWHLLCPFLGVATPQIAFPHENRGR